MFLLILYNFITCCFDLIPYYSLDLVMTNSTLNSTCSDDGFVNIYLCMYLCSLWGKYQGWMLSVVINVIMTE